jgi:acyl-CoA synthetase (AMP-forming)/AMP-acid ligase II
VKLDPSGWRTRLDEETIARYVADGSWLNRTIADRLDEVAARNPAAPLVIDGVRTLTAGDLQSAARRLSGAMAGMGLHAGDVVSFQLPNWHEAVIVDLACAYGGFVSNPIVPIYRDAEVNFILANARSRLLFVTENFRGFNYADMVDRLRSNWPHLIDVVFVRGDNARGRSMDDLLAKQAVAATSRPRPDDVKLIMYTSGTTGPAKGVLHTHNTLGAEISNFIKWLGLSGNDVLLMPSPLTHITGYLYGLMLPITLGNPVILMDFWKASVAADLIEKHAVTFTLGATPFLQELTALARSEHRGFPTLRYFPTGGAPVPPEVIHEARQAFENAVSFRIYGSTEAPTVALGVPDPDREDLAANTEGYVVGHDIRLVDDHGREVADGEEGEIISRGPENCVGYANWDDNAEAFDPEGFFHTGDLARRTPEGCLVITGRKKDLIIRGGENLSPKEVEDVLYTHPSIKEAAVVAMPHRRLGETGCAFVTLKSGALFTFDDMIKLLENSGLAKQKFPERLEVVDSLPYTVAGKIRKTVLRDQIRTRIAEENAVR